ncbi:2',3'-cyclic-nucleotide 2'-phosphodiesterase (5'-nucleotidase family) [Alkalibacillus flavidus]|uniref:2',3'-cyclic-nucleotide 2'-phosphodiesterase (5'-nucleotidase family) n=1 Tax=Alkalibacillus flavidus TaxID=546021 RepID=A0ABV2KYN8_9BACI
MMQEQLHLYFTSDLHSYFDNWPHVIAGIKHQQAIHQAKGDYTLLLDNGDHLDRVHPITEATLGQANVDLLNKAGYDVVTLGNNEGITLPGDELYHLYDEADFQITCANVAPIESPSPNWLKPYHILTTDYGTTIGVLGVTAPFKKFYELLGWQVEDPKAILDEYIPLLREMCDIVIVLSHLGLYEDEQMAEQYPVDVIIGGHTHHLIEQGRIEHGSIINAVGKQGFHYGYIHIQYDHDKGEIESMAGNAIPVSDERDDKTYQALDEWKDTADEHLNESVTYLNNAYPIEWFEETTLMREFVEELRQWTTADVAALNSGLLLTGFEQGSVTKKQIHESCPHPMNPCKMTMTGRELIETVRLFESERFQYNELKGLGFRGEILGKMVYANLTLKYSHDHQVIESVYIGDKLVDSDESYTLATADTFSFPWLIPSISHVEQKQYFMPEFLRDVLTKCLSNT